MTSPIGIERMRASGVPVTVEPYPAGDAGIRKSLSVALPLIRDGRHDQDLKEWGRKALVACGLDGRTAETLDTEKRIKCLLDAFRAVTTYVPDGVMSEQIVKPHAVLCLGKVCIPGVDCGSLAGTLGALLSSHGIPVYAVHQKFGVWPPGHSLAGKPKQEHLLLGTILPSGGGWDGKEPRHVYIDPSTRDAPYVGSKATEEEWINPFEAYAPAGLGKLGVDFVTLGRPDHSGIEAPSFAGGMSMQCPECVNYAWTPEMGPAVNGHHPACSAVDGYSGRQATVPPWPAGLSAHAVNRVADQLGLAAGTAPRPAAGALAHGLGLTTPIDVLQYKTMWDEFVMGTVAGFNACAVQDPANSATYVKYASSISQAWSNFDGTSSADMLLNASMILSSYQHTVLYVGQTARPLLAQGCPAIAASLVTGPTAQSQAFYISSLEGAGVIVAGLLSILGTTASGTFGALQTFAGNAAGKVSQGFDFLTSPWPWAAVIVVGVGYLAYQAEHTATVVKGVIDHARRKPAEST